MGTKNEKDLQSLIKAIESLKQEIFTNRKEITNKIDAFETRISFKLEQLNKKVADLENENEILKRKLETIERGTKRNNILIFGLNYDQISFDVIKNSLRNLLDVNINVQDINNFYRLGNSRNNPVKIELLSYLKKIEILKNCKKLKGSNISISSDLTESQREENLILRQHLKKARQNSNLSSYIKGNILFINNQPYKASDLKNIEIEEDTQQRKGNSAPPTPNILQNHEQASNQIYTPKKTPENTSEKRENTSKTNTNSAIPPNSLNQTDLKEHPKAKELKSRTRSGSNR